MDTTSLAGVQSSVIPILVANVLLDRSNLQLNSNPTSGSKTSPHLLST
jgi:hypothetical protein